MIKSFCDLCGSPAIQRGPGLDIKVPAPALTNKKWEISVLASFSFSQHDLVMSTLTPDLCQSCRIRLIGDLLNKAKAEYAASSREQSTKAS